MYLLDTNVISEVRRPSRHGSVVSWLSAQAPASLFVPSIVFLELQRGIELTRLQNTEKAGEIERWVDDIARVSNVLNFDAAAAREYSRFVRRRPDLVSEDAMIAAMARVNSLTVATRNTRDFERFNVPLVNPFLHQG